MSEQTITQQTARVFWPRDYARLADALRRARKGKTPDQLKVVDELTAATAIVLATDYADFSTEKFTSSARLRIETIHLDEYKAWAEQKGYGLNSTDAPEHYTEFYAQRFAGPGYADASVEDVNLPDDDEEDDTEEDDEGSLGI